MVRGGVSNVELARRLDADRKDGAPVARSAGWQQDRGGRGRLLVLGKRLEIFGKGGGVGEFQTERRMADFVVLNGMPIELQPKR